MQYAEEPGETESLEGFALVGEDNGVAVADVVRVRFPTEEFASGGSRPEQAIPEAARIIRRDALSTGKVPVSAADVNPARAAPDCRLVDGKGRLNRRTDNGHERTAEEPAQGGRELQRSLPRSGIGIVLLGDPNAEVDVGAKNTAGKLLGIPG